MKIKITDVLPIVNPPEVGSVHTVTRRETEPPRNHQTFQESKRQYILPQNANSLFREKRSGTRI